MDTYFKVTVIDPPMFFRVNTLQEVFRLLYGFARKNYVILIEEKRISHDDVIFAWLVGEDVV